MKNALSKSGLAGIKASNKNFEQSELKVACVQTPSLPQEKSGEETIFSEGGGGGGSVHRLN